MKHRSALLLLFFILVFVAAAVRADCRHNGKDYPVGTVINGLVCTKDGWRKL